MEFSTRAATNADLPAIRELVENCLAEFGMVIDFQKSDADLVDLEASYPVSDGLFLVAVDRDGSIIGTVGLRALQPSQMMLRKMYVATDARGRGIGRSLFEAVLEEARRAGASSVMLETMESMEAAIRMYEAAGFRQIPGAIKSPRCQRLYRLDLRSCS